MAAAVTVPLLLLNQGNDSDDRPAGREESATSNDADGDGVPDDEDPAPFDEDDNIDEAPGEDAADGPRQKYKAVGEAAGDDKVTFRVTAIQEVASIPGGEFSGPITPRSGSKLIRVDLTYKNNMAVPIDLLCGGGTGFVLLDENDRNFHPIEDVLDIAGNEEVCSEEVQPGFRSSVVLAFRMPRRSDIGGLVVWNSEAESDFDGEISQIVFLPE